MLANFKKIGVAAAVATAIGVCVPPRLLPSGTPADALLVFPSCMVTVPKAPIP